ncbi:DsbA family protein [Cylindrospermopsis raciborskii]|uniref:Disulfide bond formation protein DsbA n=1 Tax=Cylindrospermopsis raciborskii CENA302 TaxID=1170768 RepID=A0A9Q5QXF8_9CYAN|nr:DsbA family protein [Cylindrospermopsis raciborskii]NLQ03862.1 DsbA family protein [Cylindrospermopsis raciborskii MVCC19]OHY33274.1 disulfide bond formation protein DsbA [Cylindrospermopsis raciborskii MVCC14]OPH09977.1 disulfide bond formation protein DsbA [Cylindrospermopsis raciborskii CENA302]
MSQVFKNWIVRISSILLSTLFWSALILPTYAQTQIDPKLEQQVLEIIRRNPITIIEAVQAYQEEQQQRVITRRQEFIKNFSQNPQDVIANSPTIGSSKLQTVLLEFSDFECPYCSEAHKTLKNLLKKYPNRFTLVYKHFPLFQIHSQALPAARAAWAAHQQGKFWQYHDTLFTKQNQLGESLYIETAKSLKLDLGKFNQDRQLADKEIQKDLDLVNNLNLSGTPSFIITSPNFTGPIQLSELETFLATARN